MTPDEVEVGLLFPDTGPAAATFATTRAGVDARLGLANASGGVHGRRITYRWRDDQSGQAANLTASRMLVEKDDVFAIVETTTAASGGAEYLAEKQVPVVGFAVEEAWTRHRNMFTFNYFYTDDGSVDTFGRFVRDQGGTRPLIVWDPVGGSTGRKLVDQYAASLRAAGLEVPSDSVVGYTPAFGVDEIARRIVADDIDTLVGSVPPSGFAEIVSAARRAGARLKVIMGGGSVDDSLVEQYGSAVAGMTSFAALIPFQVDSPALDTYRAAMAQYAPQLSEPDQTVALASYVLADMLLRGLQEAGPCPTRQSFISGLRAVDNYNAGGLISNVDLEEDFGRLSTCYTFVRVNAAGTGIEVAAPNFCGKRLPG